MVMIDFLKKDQQHDGNPVVNISEVLNILKNEDRMIDWDDADDTLSLLNSSYHNDMPILIAALLDQSATLDARSYSIDAMLRIEPDLHSVAAVLASGLQDKDPIVRSEIAKALSNCALQDYQNIVPALAAAARDWNSTIGSQAAALSTLVNLIGICKAIKSLL